MGSFLTIRKEMHFVALETRGIIFIFTDLRTPSYTFLETRHYLESTYYTVNTKFYFILLTINLFHQTQPSLKFLTLKFEVLRVNV